MSEKVVGKIRSVTYIEDEDVLDFTIRVTDPKFKKKLLRDLSLAGKIKLRGDKIVYVDEEEDKNADV